MMLAFIFDSVGFGEWFVLLSVVLIFVGPKKLPSVAKTIGNYYAKFRRTAENFKRQIMEMETEVTQEAEKMTDAFRVDGDESQAIPSVDSSDDPLAESNSEGEGEGDGEGDDYDHMYDYMDETGYGDRDDEFDPEGKEEGDDAAGSSESADPGVKEAEVSADAAPAAEAAPEAATDSKAVPKE